MRQLEIWNLEVNNFIVYLRIYSGRNMVWGSTFKLMHFSLENTRNCQLLLLTITQTFKLSMFCSLPETPTINTDPPLLEKFSPLDNKDPTLPKLQTHQEYKFGNIQNGDDDALDQQLLKKKTQNKQKYRRLKQKLTTMCIEHQEKCLTKDHKEVSSPNKSRLLTLAIEFEKMTLNQTKDYLGLQAKLKQILKILDHKREHDLLILKHSRLVPALSLLLKKVPAFHKHEFTQSLKTIELGLKLLRIFCTLSSNRDYMISTNQVVILNSCLSSFYSKEEKKLTVECVGVLHEILGSRIKADSEQIIAVTVQIVFFGQLGRKIRLGVQSCIGEDNQVVEEQFILKSFKYLYLLYKKYFERALDKPIYSQSQMAQFMQHNSDAILFFLEMFIPTLLMEKEGGMKDQELPFCVIDICLYALKLLNLNTHVNLKAAQKVIDLDGKSNFTVALRQLFQYAKRSIEQGEQIHEITCICSEIITFLGKISCNNPQIKKNIRESGLLDSLCNHPMIYLMDQKLKSILISSLCSIMQNNQQNMKKYLSESSCQQVVKFIITSRKFYEQTQAHKFQEEESQPSEDIESIFSEEPAQNLQKPQQMICNYSNNNKILTRKSSVSSMNSYTTQCTQNSYNGYLSHQEKQKDNHRLLNLVPFFKWQQLQEQLQRLDS